MPRYFLEVSYKGTLYSGFQKQENSNTIQAEIEKAFAILHKHPVELTGSSRTDAGVHAIQNFFHFDFEDALHAQFLYKMNAILPEDIVVISFRQVADTAHCRFDATSRLYRYCIYQSKDPFLKDSAYFFPYRLNKQKLDDAAKIVMHYSDFSSFSKRNTQVKTFICRIEESVWVEENNLLVYRVKGNRFLRGMVRGLTGTMLRIARGDKPVDDLHRIFEARDCSLADFAVPAKGLFLTSVVYPPEVFSDK